VARWNRRINLTAHRSPEAVIERLVLDSLALARILPPFRSLVDIGSGAGFPGLPAAILLPDRRVTLVEARERRHHFQRAAVRELGLENVRVVRGRAEDLHPVPHDVVVAQAVARPDKVLGWMLPWARRGGHLVIPGGPTAPAPSASPEVSDARAIFYAVPVSGARRSAWIGRRE
jgi:16S rRNA (guanine527-N7)-methyltransferase